MNKLSSKKALEQQNLMDYFDEFAARLRNSVFSKAGLAIGTSSKTAVKIANTVVYQVDGVMLSNTTEEVAFTATTYDIPAHATLVQERCYLICLDASLTATMVAGTIASGAGNATVPEATAGTTPVGYPRLAVAAGATSFDATTDELDEAHLTDTYVDFGVRLPKFSAAYENGGVTAA